MKKDYILAGREAMAVYDAFGGSLELLSRDKLRAFNTAVDEMNKILVRTAPDEFHHSFTIITGRKYAKVINRQTKDVSAFVVMTDTDKKFRRGDILMAAGYKRAARNSARGNVLDGGYDISWTGPRDTTKFL